MQGMMVFTTLSEAIRHGFEPYARIAEGHLVRMKTAAGWALALVVER